MPRYKPNLKFSDCWSSIGNVSFYHRDGKCFWRTRPSTPFRTSAGRIAQTTVHHRALLAWQRLPSSVQNIWRRYAIGVTPHRPPFLKDSHISGYNLFVSAYHGFAQLGMERVPEPAPFPAFPQFHLTPVSASVDGNATVCLCCDLQVWNVQDPDRYRLSARIQLTAPGRGCNPGHMRTYLAQTISVRRFRDYCTVRVSFVITPSDFRMNGNGAEVQIYLRYRLIDTITGYRNDFRSTSSLLEIH